MELLFQDGTKALVGLAVGDSAQSAVSPSQVVFDKYQGSANYADVNITLALSAGTTLESVKIGSTVLERGTDYTYNAATGVVTLLRDALAKRSRGTYGINFVVSKGNSLTCSLTIEDTAPVNTVSPSEIDFDSNPNSSGFTDLTVTLSPVEGATLKYIRANNKTLEENWQYRVSGNQVTINKSALSELGSNGATFVDFTFVMSTGENPVLTVNYVTTYALTTTVVDDLGMPVSGAAVTVTPSDAADGSATQTAYTDSNGQATVYVKRGSYEVTASHARFTQSVSTKTSVSSARSVKLTGEILETVQIVVTNVYGAPLSGAIVSIGGKSITTGTDGTASFNLRRGSYVAQVACTGYKTQSVTLAVNGTIRERVQMS